MPKNFSLLKTLIITLFIINVLFIPKVASASLTNPNSFVVTKGYYDSSKPIPPDLQNAPDCPQACNVAGQCANSQNPGNCGLQACDGGNAWTKYNVQSCKFVKYDPDLDELRCQALYTQGEVVYSIGDKCISGGPYLNPGYCESAYGGPIYKTCCSGDGNALSPFQCVAFDSDHAGDPEGRCPAGYTREVFCGQPGQPECGQPACGPVGPTF